MSAAHTQAVLLLTAYFSKANSGEAKPLSNKEWGRFAALSQNERLSCLVAKGRALLYSRGFRKGPRSGFGLLRRHPYYAHLWQITQNSIVQVHILAFPTINKTSTKGASFYWDLPKLTRKQDLIVREVRSFTVVAALQASREQSLTALLPNWMPLAKGIFTKKGITKFDGRPQSETVMFIDGIRTQDEFVNRFRPMIDTMT